MDNQLYSMVYKLQREIKELRIKLEEVKKEVENCKEGKK